jgi:hypothetical protein
MTFHGGCGWRDFFWRARNNVLIPAIAAGGNSMMHQ